MRLDPIVDTSQDRSSAFGQESNVRALMLGVLDRAILDLAWYRGAGGRKAVDTVRHKATLHQARLESSARWTQKQRRQWAYRMSQYENHLDATDEIAAWWGMEPYRNGNAPEPGEAVSLEMVSVVLDIPVESLRKWAIKLSDPVATAKRPLRSIFADGL